LAGFLILLHNTYKISYTAAVAIFNDKQIPLPDNQVSDKQILSLIEYIKSSDSDTTVDIVKYSSGDTIFYDIFLLQPCLKEEIV